MKRLRYTVAACAITALATIALSGCFQNTGSLSVSNVREVANLSTIECTYHSVARYGNEANQILINPLRWGYKKYWFEYDAVLEVGVDAAKIEFVEVPEEDGTVVITMPYAEVTTQPNIIETSMTDPITETGFVTSISDDDKKNALMQAQQDIRDKAASDDALKFQARERAKDLIEQYIVNIGKELGFKYTVKFVDPS